MILNTVAFMGVLAYGIRKYNRTRTGRLKNRLIDERSWSSTTVSRDIKYLAKQGQANACESTGIQETDNRKATKSLVYSVTLVASGLIYRPLGLLSVPFLLYAINEPLRHSYRLLKRGKTDVNTLMSITMIGCLLLGKLIVANLLVSLYMVALTLTAKSLDRAQDQLVNTLDQHPTHVWKVVNDVEISIPYNEMRVGDIVVIQAGEIIPADGTVVSGMASVDQHILTGEARPVEREVGEQVFASTIILSGKIQVKVDKAGEDSTAANITRILTETIDFKSSTQLRAEQLSEELVNPVLVAGGVALPLLGFSSALAVISAHPKNKIMLVAPLTILNYLRMASSAGILIKDGRSLELLNQVTTLVFDKTGTLTEEIPHVGLIHTCAVTTSTEILAFAAAAESKQTHPLAQAILQEAKVRDLELPSVKDSEYRIGYGLTVTIENRVVDVGSERFMRSLDIPLPEEIQRQQKRAHEEGYTLVMVAVDQQLVGAIELLPTIRQEAKAVIQALKRRDQITATYIISGDNEGPTKQLAAALGIDHFFAEVLPQRKAELIEELQQQGHCVCYIGDGINDAIALKKAHVSISLRGASTIATDTAQIVLMDQGLSHLGNLFDLAKRFESSMNRTFAILLAPALLGISGAFFLGFGVAHAIALNMLGLFLGIANAAIPALQPPRQHLGSGGISGKTAAKESIDLDNTQVIAEEKRTNWRRILVHLSKTRQPAHSRPMGGCRDIEAGREDKPVVCSPTEIAQ
ncbi:MAG: heavy metal translocating P-type ATPase [Thiohalocapsa sp. PB-PSB1]|jgi:heavy metal translocating P-type ATPase|nr:MAG: hypothetical protein N838_29215 [Thiohalocapsa sp. PB-PSB1]QQO55996.1 MAG: heavy metal translocating P-type ATPase [Thiohalocapsa sp. PB-PSB1]HCS91176.1 heavy metal translocating P-type ATPase [Chromatiaceae bacterium]